MSAGDACRGAQGDGGTAQAITLAFSGLTFTVRDKRTGAEVQILKGVDGKVCRGGAAQLGGSHAPAGRL